MSPVDVMKACPCHLLNLTSFTLITGGKTPKCSCPVMDFRIRTFGYM